MWQKVAKFKGAEYFRKALYCLNSPNPDPFRSLSTPPSSFSLSMLVYRVISLSLCLPSVPCCRSASTPMPE